ncbi:MAG: c-type cytochrome [Terriglobales bacterium]
MMNWLGGRTRGFASRSSLGISLGLAIAIFVCLPTAVSGQNHKASAAMNSGANSADVARGKYLVESVAMCGQCHTPRDANGVVQRSKWLEGAAVPWIPAQPQSNWPLLAPRIGGTPPASDADMIKLLTTGIWTNGEPLRFPMEPFRMSEADARAVIAYLKTPSAWK